MPHYRRRIQVLFHFTTIQRRRIPIDRTMQRLIFVSTLLAATLVVGTSGFVSPSQSRPNGIVPPLRAQTRETAVKDGEVDLCTINESFCEVTDDGLADSTQASGFSYAQFAKDYPFANNIGIATAKTAAADLVAQVVVAQTPVDAIDWQRSLLFCAFGAIYLGGFQYLYQVNIFKKLFDVDSFTNKSLEEKLQDGPGLRALAAQTALDLTVLTAIYLPTFYIFKAGVFSGSMDPSVWTATGIENYQQNFAKDEVDLLRVWFPADIVCFSVPLYLRLPVRHIVSFVWTAYLSFARGGH